MSESNKNKKWQDKTLEFVEDTLKFLRKLFFLIFDGIFDAIEFVVGRVFRISKTAQAMRVIAFILSIMIAIVSIEWAFEFVNNPPEGYDAVDIAAIVGAVLTPITGILTGVLVRFVFNKEKAEDSGQCNIEDKVE